MRNHTRLATTDSGRATSSSAPPISSAGPTASTSRSGEASSPSSTNRPIWAREAMPSANPMLAARCGSVAFPSTSPQR